MADRSDDARTLAEMAETDRRMAAEAAHDADLELPVSAGLPDHPHPDIAAADQVRAEDDVRVYRRQATLAELQAAAAEEIAEEMEDAQRRLYENAERLEATGREVRARSEDLRALDADTRQLRDETRELAEQARDIRPPDV
jgi:hypothetical protein